MDLITAIESNNFVGKKYLNPGGGFSTIIRMTEDYIYYVRGNSTIAIPYYDMDIAYYKFIGKRCKTTDLKLYNPKVFDSKCNGHSCNCTFFFCLLEDLGMTVNGICGKGLKGSPFYVDIINNSKI